MMLRFAPTGTNYSPHGEGDLGKGIHSCTYQMLHRSPRRASSAMAILCGGCARRMWFLVVPLATANFSENCVGAPAQALSGGADSTLQKHNAVAVV